MEIGDGLLVIILFFFWRCSSLSFDFFLGGGGGTERTAKDLRLVMQISMQMSRLGSRASAAVTHRCNGSRKHGTTTKAIKQEKKRRYRFLSAFDRFPFLRCWFFFFWYNLIRVWLEDGCVLFVCLFLVFFYLNIYFGFPPVTRFYPVLG